MKKFIFVSLILFSVAKTWAQSCCDTTLFETRIYYDAVELANVSTEGKRKTEILLHYYNLAIFENPEHNIFLKGLITKLKKWDYNRSVPFSSSSFLNTDVTHFATGLSRFLAERAKEEMNEVFFRQMTNKLKEYSELNAIFPFTTELLNKRIINYGYASSIQVLKDAFEADMRNLPQNLYLLKDFDYADNNDKRAIKREKVLKDFYQKTDGLWFQLGLITLRETLESSNPANLLNKMAGDPVFKNLKLKLKNDSIRWNEYNLLSLIELNNEISQSLLGNRKDRIWITPQQLEDTLLKKPEIFKCYLGLLLAKEQNRNQSNDTLFFYKDAKNKITFSEILCDNTKNYYDEEDKRFDNSIKLLIRNIYMVFNASDIAAKKIQNASENFVEADPAVLYNYYRTITNMIRPVAQDVSKITGIKNVKYEKIENFINPAVDMVYHTLIKQYTSAIFDAIVLLSSLKGESYDFNKVTQSFVTYGTLIGSVATAQSSDEVKKAIEASVLPMGSSAMKRNSKCSIMLNAYVGGYYGLGKQDSIGCFKTYGLYAPVGFSGSWGGWKKCRGALSLSLNVFDLGSLVNIYLKDGETVLPDDFSVRLVNIISPGIQLSYLFRQTPFAVFIGTNYIPELYENKGGYRWQAGLAIDIPMYKIALW